MLLKAFVKSSFTVMSPFCDPDRNLRSAWTAASQPPATPTPNCLGLKTSESLAETLALAHLAAKRRNVLPTAMGLIPPDFLFRAISLPPKKQA
jgi:hypothetical protein